jgi:hypothetical protein
MLSAARAAKVDAVMPVPPTISTTLSDSTRRSTAARAPSDRL